MQTTSSMLKVARRKRGIVTRQDLVDAGFSTQRIDRAVGAELLRIIHPGVYFAGTSAPTWEQHLLAAVRATEPHGTVAGASAAALLRIDGYLPGPVQLVVPYAQNFHLEGCTVRRSRDFDPENDRRIVQGLPVTKVARTLLDLLEVSTEAQLVVAVESLLRTRRYMLGEIRTYVRDRARGRKGTRRLVELISERICRPATDDAYELLAEQIMRRAELRPVRQVWLKGADGAAFARADFLFPDERVVLEVDGVATHGRAEAIRSDHARDAKLIALGYFTFRVTPWELKNTPEAFIASLKRVLDARRPTPLEQLAWAKPDRSR